MKCPVCNNVDLQMSERQNIEIDYCPNCRGVWLDRGELDKIIERSSRQDISSMPHSNNQHSYNKYPNHGKYYKKKSFLSELFD